MTGHSRITRLSACRRVPSRRPRRSPMMLLGFAGLGFAGYRKAKRNDLLAA
jgi:hypothetical protein